MFLGCFYQAFCLLFKSAVCLLLLQTDLEEPAHDVEDGGLPDGGVVAALGVEGGVAGHEEVEVGRRDERRNQPDQVVVHV